MTWLLPSVSCYIMGIIWDKHQQMFFPSNNVLCISDNHHDWGCGTPHLIPVNKQATLDKLVAHCGAVGNPCNLQSYSAGFILSITNMLAATNSTLTWSWLYSPENFPLLFVMIFLSYSTPATQGYTTTSARWGVDLNQADWRVIHQIG